MEKRSPHILNASSNLLGFCLIILTSLRISKIDHSTYLDEFAVVAILCLSSSCVCSFLSIKSKNENFSDKIERIADVLFLSALLCITLAACIVSLDLF
ncbi:hypothetical protein [Chryseobacterium sp. T1]